MRPVLFEIPWASFPSPAWYLLFAVVFFVIGWGLSFLAEKKSIKWLADWSYIIAAAVVIGVVVFIVKVYPPHGLTITYKPIYGYGTMLGISFIVGWYLTIYLGRLEKIPVENMQWLLIIIVVSSLFGARLFHVISNPKDWSHFFAFQRGGLVAYGGFIVAMIAGAIYIKMKNLDVWRTFDVFTPAIALGLGITRIGCFLRGCCYGKRTDSFLGISFPKESLVWQQHHSRGWHVGENWSDPVFPTQLFESALGFLLFGITVWMLIKKRDRLRGSVFLTFMGLYAIGRFLLEFIRDDGGRAFYFGHTLSESQLYGILVLVFVLFAWHYLKTHPVPSAEAVVQQEQKPKKSDSHRPKQKKGKSKKK